MSASISQLIPELQPFARDLVDAAGAAGLQPRITSTRRTSAEQARLYRRYQQGLNPYPVAPPGTSAHEFGFAFDMMVTPADALPDVGAYWKANGGVWGGEFNDPIHFEYPGFKQRDSGILEVVGSHVRSWAEFIDQLPWYVSLAMPTALLTEPKNENIESAAARVMDWVHSHF